VDLDPKLFAVSGYGSGKYHPGPTLKIVLPSSPEIVILKFSTNIQKRYDMNRWSQMQDGQNWILLKEINADRFFLDFLAG
jgi:hypothetical protein